MFLKTLFFAAAFGFAATLSQAAGLKPIEVPADDNGPLLKAFVWSPCAAEPSETRLGPIILKANRGCSVAGEMLPLIVISHGHAGSALGHHDTAETLADAGFIVAALNHPGDNFSDMSRSGDISTFVERPLDIKRLLDFMTSAYPDADRIDPQRIGFFGFSRGGYTGLVLAGAKPDFHDPSIVCPEPAPICGEILRNELPIQPLTRDPRIKAFVLADPLSFFPTRDSLKSIKAPVQLWGSQYGGDGVLPQSIASLSENLPDRPQFHLVGGAGHFAFLAPCSAELAASQSEICTDMSGFDRVAFHRLLNAEVVAFFSQQLNVPGSK